MVHFLSPLLNTSEPGLSKERKPGNRQKYVLAHNPLADAKPAGFAGLISGNSAIDGCVGPITQDFFILLTY